MVIVDIDPLEVVALALDFLREQKFFKSAAAIEQEARSIFGRDVLRIPSAQRLHNLLQRSLLYQVSAFICANPTYEFAKPEIISLLTDPSFGGAVASPDLRVPVVGGLQYDDLHITYRRAAEDMGLEGAEARSKNVRSVQSVYEQRVAASTPASGPVSTPFLFGMPPTRVASRGALPASRTGVRDNAPSPDARTQGGHARVSPESGSSPGPAAPPAAPTSVAIPVCDDTDSSIAAEHEAVPEMTREQAAVADARHSRHVPPVPVEHAPPPPPPAVVPLPVFEATSSITSEDGQSDAQAAAWATPARSARRSLIPRPRTGQREAPPPPARVADPGATDHMFASSLPAPRMRPNAAAANASASTRARRENGHADKGRGRGRAPPPPAPAPPSVEEELDGVMGRIEAVAASRARAGGYAAAFAERTQLRKRLGATELDYDMLAGTTPAREPWDPSSRLSSTQGARPSRIPVPVAGPASVAALTSQRPGSASSHGSRLSAAAERHRAAALAAEATRNALFSRDITADALPPADRMRRSVPAAREAEPAVTRAPLASPRGTPSRHSTPGTAVSPYDQFIPSLHGRRSLNTSAGGVRRSVSGSPSPGPSSPRRGDDDDARLMAAAAKSIGATTGPRRRALRNAYTASPTTSPTGRVSTGSSTARSMRPGQATSPVAATRDDERIGTTRSDWERELSREPSSREPSAMRESPLRPELTLRDLATAERSAGASPGRVKISLDSHWGINTMQSVLDIQDTVRRSIDDGASRRPTSATTRPVVHDYARPTSAGSRAAQEPSLEFLASHREALGRKTSSPPKTHPAAATAPVPRMVIDSPHTSSPPQLPAGSRARSPPGQGQASPRGTPPQLPRGSPHVPPRTPPGGRGSVSPSRVSDPLGASLSPRERMLSPRERMLSPRARDGGAEVHRYDGLGGYERREIVYEAPAAYLPVGDEGDGESTETEDGFHATELSPAGGGRSAAEPRVSVSGQPSARVARDSRGGDVRLSSPTRAMVDYSRTSPSVLPAAAVPMRPERERRTVSPPRQERTIVVDEVGSDASSERPSTSPPGQRVPPRRSAGSEQAAELAAARAAAFSGAFALAQSARSAKDRVPEEPPRPPVSDRISDQPAGGVPDELASRVPPELQSDAEVQEIGGGRRRAGESVEPAPSPPRRVVTRRMAAEERARATGVPQYSKQLKNRGSSSGSTED